MIYVVIQWYLDKHYILVGAFKQRAQADAMKYKHREYDLSVEEWEV